MDISDSYDQTQQQQSSIDDSMCDSPNGFSELPPEQQQLHQQQQHAIINTTAIPLPAPNQSLKQLQLQQEPPNGQLFPPMAADNTSTTATDIEIDSLLLQQFSCLGTTDHEDLVKQFQTIMSNQMNEDSARFFLEMSNWNLQTAVGCYLDFCNFQTLPSMKILQKQQLGEHQQAWRLQNDGSEEWPKGCYLISPTQTRRIELPVIRPGETCDIFVNLPVTQPAIAVCWRLCTPNGWYFGEMLWMAPPGTTTAVIGGTNIQEDLATRMSMLHTSSSSSTSISSNSSSTGGPAAITTGSTAATTSITAVNPEHYPQADVVISVNME